MKYLKQSTAVTVIVGVFPNPTTGLAVTTLTSQTGRSIKNGTGGAFTPASWSHDGGGHYLVGLGTGDTDTVGRLRLAFDSGANYLPVWEDFSVLSAAVYDWLFGTAAPSTPATAQTIDLTTAISSNPTAGTVGASLYYGDKAIGRRNTAQAGTSNTITLDAAASANDNAFRGHQITLTGGTGSGQTATIVGYVGSTKVATIVRDGGSGGWATTPDATTTFMIIPQALANVGMWLGGTVNALASGRVDASVGAYPGNAAQTGDSFARIGAAGAGLTAVGDARLANLDAAITTRLATSGYSAAPSAATVAAAAWDLATSGHATAGTFGAAMAAAGTAGDPWSTAIPGSYAAGTAGAKLGGTLNANVVTVLGGAPVPADLNNVGLKPTGLDQIAATAPVGVPATFPGWLMWVAQRFKRSYKTPTSLVVEGDAGATLTTQAVTDDGAGNESIGPPA